MKHRRLLGILLALTLVCLNSAFGGDKTKDIIGKWTDLETGQTVEYKDDGSLEQTLLTGSMIRGRYFFRTRRILRWNGMAN